MIIIIKITFYLTMCNFNDVFYFKIYQQKLPLAMHENQGCINETIIKCFNGECLNAGGVVE